ncbi:MAG: hypothetical protein H6839_00385 [Planctomycetes bacterium]|nr:hypothetical protein [Planctomycetota bacterium]
MANCPKCGFAGASFTQDGARRCARCSEVYYTGVQYPSPPGYAASVATPGGNKRAVLIVAGAVAVLVAAIAVLALANAEPEARYEGEQPRPLAANESAATPETEPEDGRLSAAITPVMEAMNGSSPWWLLTYRNIGEVTISRPGVTGTFEADGVVLKTQSFAGTVYSLPPGGEIWIRVVPGLSQPAKATFKVDKLQKATRYTTPYKQLEVISHEAQHTSGKYSTVTGRVRNQTDAKSASVHVFAIGYNAAGAPCSFVDAYVSGSGIDPGADGEFTLYAGIWQNELPKRWELTAWGRVSK